MHHRQVKIPDLLIAAVAARNGLTVIHYDSDYEIIASVTGQPTAGPPLADPSDGLVPKQNVAGSNPVSRSTPPTWPLAGAVLPVSR